MRKLGGRGNMTTPVRPRERGGRPLLGGGGEKCEYINAKVTRPGGR